MSFQKLARSQDALRPTWKKLENAHKPYEAMEATEGRSRAKRQHEDLEETSLGSRD